jgi:hypothetical protein
MCVSKPIAEENPLGTFIIALTIALVITWKFPNCVAKTKQRVTKTQEKLTLHQNESMHTEEKSLFYLFCLLFFS